MATFLGRCALIDGQVGGKSDGLTRVETAALGPVFAAGDAASSVHVRLALRPEAVQILGAGKIEVTDAMFTGNAMRLTLRCPDGTLIEADLPRGAAVPAPGAKIGCTITPGAATVLTE